LMGEKIESSRTWKKFKSRSVSSRFSDTKNFNSIFSLLIWGFLLSVKVHN
jgi:hypothetical protein